MRRLTGNIWVNKFVEAALCVAPIFFTVLGLYLSGNVSGISNEGFWFFVVCTLLLGAGLALFNIGVDSSMTRIGTLLGETLTKHGSIFLLISMTFVLGFLVTVAEPDLAVLASQISVNKILTICIVAVGIGIFLVVGVLRVLSKKSLKIMFLAFYALIFALVGIARPDFLPFSFDSGGVTTGPVTVPFILAFGAGVAMSTSAGKGGEDAFGFSALCSVGPILILIIVSFFLPKGALDYGYTEAAFSYPSLGMALLNSLRDVGIAFGPMVLFFLVFDLLFIKLSKKALLKIIVGLIYDYVGLVIFLSGVTAGFLPMAQRVGSSLASGNNLPLIISATALFGLFAILAEPAVHVLVKQIENVSEGTIKARTVLIVMSLANALAVVISILRIYFEIPILYFLIPGYILAMVLMIFTPNIYTYIAFDSGSVSAGPIASTFILPFALGFCHALDHDVYSYAFGVVGIVSLMPLIVIQMLGVYAVVKRNLIYSKARKRFIEPDDDQIIHFVGAGS